MKWWPPFSAAAFNAMLHFARRWRALEGRGIKLLPVEGRGVIISAEELDEPPHPWRVRCSPALDADGNPVFHARVRPGLVNGRDVFIGTGTGLAALTDDPAPTLVIPADAWRNPLASASFTATESESVIAAAGEGYPKFFERLGVAPAFAGGRVDPADLGNGAPPDATRTRQIRAVDIVLSAPRLASAQTTAIDPAGNVTIDTSYDAAAVAERGDKPFRLHLTSKWTPPLEPSSLDRLDGSAVEPLTDERKIATVWIVSPPDTAPDATPDASWTPYPQHDEFWNLNHASPKHLASAPQKPITLVTGLAGGIADAIFAELLRPVNESNALLDAYLGAANTRGQFYT